MAETKNWTVDIVLGERDGRVTAGGTGWRP
jgi:hypothetical protein